MKKESAAPHAAPSYQSPLTKKDREILSYIRTHLTEPLDLSGLCAALGVNRTTLALSVRKQTGLAPMQYVRRERLKLAAEALILEQKSVREIALSCGFEDENYFIRAFKREYGQTPLQYRLSPGEQRPDPQKQQPLTPALFADYVEKGLGRAILLLRQQQDKEPFKKPFLDHVFTSGEILGIYERDLLDCFEDRKELRALIGQTLLDSLKKDCSKRSVSIPLLHLLGFREEVREIVEQYYTHAHGALTEALKRGRFSFENESKEHPSPETLYMNAAGILGRFVKPGQRRMRAVLSDIADFFDYCEKPPIPCEKNPLYMIYDGMGREAFLDVFEEVCKSHRNGALLKKEYDLIKAPPPLPDGKALLAEQIVQTVHSSFAGGGFLFEPAFTLCLGLTPQQELQRATRALLLEKDPTSLAVFFSLCCEEDRDPRFPRPPLPLPVGELITLFDRYYAQSKEQGLDKAQARWYQLTWISILRILQQEKHAELAPLAQRLLQSEDHALFCDGLILLARNYRLCHEQILRGALKKELASPKKSIHGVYALIILAKKGEKNAPYDLLPLYFEKEKDKWDRLLIAKALFKTGEMTEELRQECMLDRLPATRELACRIDPDVSFAELERTMHL